MRTSIVIIFLIVVSLAGVFYLFAAQERSAMNCYFGPGVEEDERESQPLHLNERYR